MACVFVYKKYTISFLQLRLQDEVFKKSGGEMI